MVTKVLALFLDSLTQSSVAFQESPDESAMKEEVDAPPLARFLHVTPD